MRGVRRAANGVSGLHCRYQRAIAQQVQHPFVDEHMQAHSVLTRLSVLVRKWVSPIHAFSVPKGCSTDHHDQPQLRQMVECIWRRQDDHRAAGSINAPLPYRRNRQRILPPATQQPGGPDQDPGTGAKTTVWGRSGGQPVLISSG